MRLRRSGHVVIALALAGSACGDSTGPQIELTQQETAELFTAIYEVFGDFAEFSRANPGVSLSLMGIADDINETVGCPQGGSALVTGTENSTLTTFDLDADLDFSDCGSRGFIIGGGLNFSGSGTSTETSFAVDLTISGDLAVETDDGRSGACTTELDFSLEASATASSFSASGSICGANFSVST